MTVTLFYITNAAVLIGCLLIGWGGYFSSTVGASTMIYVRSSAMWQQCSPSLPSSALVC